MVRTTALFLVMCLTFLPVFLAAGGRRGAELIVQLKGGQQVLGELVTIKKKSLLLLNPEGSNIGVDMVDVVEITIKKKSKLLLGASLGFLLGAAFGAWSGSTFLYKKGVDLAKSDSALILAGLFAVPSALIGGLVGAGAGEDKTIQIEGKSESEIEEILEDLRSKAKVRNFQ